MKKIIAVFLIIMTMVTLAGCSQNIEEDIVGYWVAEKTEDAIIMEFTDETYTFVGISSMDLSSDKFEGTYEINEEENTIILEYKGADRIKLTYSYNEDDELYLELNNVKFVKSEKE